MSHQKLDYGDPVPILRRRRVQRALVVLTAEAVALYIIFQSVICIYYRYPPWRRWRECSEYTPPSREQVVFELDSDRACQLLATDGGYFPQEGRTLMTPAAGFSPDCWNRLAGYLKLRTGIDDQSAVLFLHGRTTRHGARRLLSIELDNAGVSWNAIASKTISWGFRGTGLTWSTGSIRWNTVIPTDERPIDRFYAGAADPADESHFTIEYEMREGKRTIDGWLLDNAASPPNDVTVMLKVRKGPTSR